MGMNDGQYIKHEKIDCSDIFLHVERIINMDIEKYDKCYFLKVYLDDNSALANTNKKSTENIVKHNFWHARKIITNYSYNFVTYLNSLPNFPGNHCTISIITVICIFFLHFLFRTTRTYNLSSK